MCEEKGIDTVTLYVHHGEEAYVEKEMDLDAFYARIGGMIDNIPTSSQPSQALLEEYFEDAGAAGQVVLGGVLGSKFSGRFEGVVQAAEATKARHEDFHYALVDSLTTCMELGWPVIDAADARNAGATFDECLEVVRGALYSTRIMFSPESMKFLEAGGRVGHATAFLGNLLNISPVLTVKDGYATSAGKGRNYQKAQQEMIKTFTKDIQEYGLKHVMVHYIGDRAPAEVWARDVVEPLVGHEVIVSPASPVLGVHVGPATGIAYECLHPIAGKHAEPGPEVVIG